jgi:hypothetical protein
MLQSSPLDFQGFSGTPGGSVRHDCDMKSDMERPSAPDEFAHICGIGGMFLMPPAGAPAASNRTRLWKTRGAS